LVCATRAVAIRLPWAPAPRRLELERLLSLKPDDPLTKFALCMAELPVLYADEAEIAERRVHYAARLESLAAEVAELPNAAALADGVGAAVLPALSGPQRPGPAGDLRRARLPRHG